ncbi:hypothetical protein EHM76_07305 [bacterium]|nr:MAG: hypothetical protein EHM76_07305 [bacterium]
MAGGHEGVYEDGVLSTCGICGCRVHMLDPDEMDWICDPCSTAGWAGTISAWKLRKGHIVSLNGNTHAVVSADMVGKWVEVETRDCKGDLGLRFMRATKRVYVHERGE